MEAPGYCCLWRLMVAGQVAHTRLMGGQQLRNW